MVVMNYILKVYQDSPIFKVDSTEQVHYYIPLQL